MSSISSSRPLLPLDIASSKSNLIDLPNKKAEVSIQKEKGQGSASSSLERNVGQLLGVQNHPSNTNSFVDHPPFALSSTSLIGNNNCKISLNDFLENPPLPFTVNPTFSSSSLPWPQYLIHEPNLFLKKWGEFYYRLHKGGWIHEQPTTVLAEKSLQPTKKRKKKKEKMKLKLKTKGKDSESTSCFENDSSENQPPPFSFTSLQPPPFPLRTTFSDRLIRRKSSRASNTASILHYLHMCVLDNRESQALSIADHLKSHVWHHPWSQAWLTHLFLVALVKHFEKFTLLCFQQGVPTSPNLEIQTHGPSFFLLAVGFGLVGLVSSMVKKANVTQSWHGLTPLLLACCSSGRGSAAIVKLLLDHDAPAHQGIPLPLYHLHQGLHLPSFPKWTSLKPSMKYIYPIDLAVCTQNYEVVQLLLSKSSPEHLRLSHFCFLVHQDPWLFVMLAKAGANVNQRDANNSTALHLAARQGRMDLVQLLTALKFDLNACNKDGNTPFREATLHSHEHVAQYLWTCHLSPTPFLSLSSSLPSTRSMVLTSLTSLSTTSSTLPNKKKTALSTTLHKFQHLKQFFQNKSRGTERRSTPS